MESLSYEARRGQSDMGRHSLTWYTNNKKKTISKIKMSHKLIDTPIKNYGVFTKTHPQMEFNQV